MEASKLNEERKRQKLSVAELSQIANLPKGTVEKVLFGIVQNPRIDTVEAIEKALGLSSGRLEWTEKDKTLGVGNHPTYLSERERKWIELGSEVIRIKGEAYYDMLEQMIEAVIKIK